LKESNDDELLTTKGKRKENISYADVDVDVLSISSGSSSSTSSIPNTENMNNQTNNQISNTNKNTSSQDSTPSKLRKTVQKKTGTFIYDSSSSSQSPITRRIESKSNNSFSTPPSTSKTQEKEEIDLLSSSSDSDDNSTISVSNQNKLLQNKILSDHNVCEIEVSHSDNEISDLPQNKKPEQNNPSDYKVYEIATSHAAGEKNTTDNESIHTNKDNITTESFPRFLQGTSKEYFPSTTLSQIEKEINLKASESKIKIWSTLTSFGKSNTNHVRVDTAENILIHIKGPDALMKRVRLRVKKKKINTEILHNMIVLQEALVNGYAIDVPVTIKTEGKLGLVLYDVDENEKLSQEVSGVYINEINENSPLPSQLKILGNEGAVLLSINEQPAKSIKQIQDIITTCKQEIKDIYLVIRVRKRLTIKV